MSRLRSMVLLAFLSGVIAGCGGESQPNAPAEPADLGPDFAKKTADMMKNANSGMDLKGAKSASKKP
ncbi:MAG: hypothetical protein ACLQGP_05835 [Isosphaeraceae bacterium]